MADSPTSRTLFVGIDPGVSGAIAMIDTGLDFHVKVEDMPSYKVRVGKTNRSVPDWYGICALIDEARHGRFMIESSSPMPRDGSSAAWATGRFYGGLEGICAAYEIPINTIRPAKWKGHFRLLKQTKDASRKRALELFPQLHEELKLKKHHGRAEALLIAEYNRRFSVLDKPLISVPVGISTPKSR